MESEFDTAPSRLGTNAVKYDERMQKFGTEDLIPLWIADMDFRTAQPIIDALEARARQGMFGYVARPADYFEKVAAWQLRHHGWAADARRMSFAVGVVPSLAALVRQLSEEGDEILIQPPVYSEFYDVPEAVGRKVLANRLVLRDGAFHLDLADFEAKLARHPKAFILCNPHNPTGHVWTRAELAAMGELCLRYGVPVIADEIHADLTLFGHRHICMASVSPEISANTITCTSTSKPFSLAGLQVSTVIFNNAEQQEMFDKFWHSLEIHRNSCFNLVASMAAYDKGEPWLTQLLPYLEGNLRFVAEFLQRELPQITMQMPESTYLAWLNCRGLGLDDAALADFMTHKAKIGLNPGTTFDRDLHGYMRMNVGCPRAVLEQAMAQLKAAVAAL